MKKLLLILGLSLLAVACDPVQPVSVPVETTLETPAQTTPNEPTETVETPTPTYKPLVIPVKVTPDVVQSIEVSPEQQQAIQDKIDQSVANALAKKAQEEADQKAQEQADLEAQKLLLAQQKAACLAPIADLKIQISELDIQRLAELDKLNKIGGLLTQDYTNKYIVLNRSFYDRINPLKQQIVDITVDCNTKYGE